MSLRVVASSTELFDATSVKWSWACRHLSAETADYRLQADRSKPRPGDVALVRVDRIGHHRYIESIVERRQRLYRGDRVTCVFGNRYATDVYEGRAIEVERLHLLTGSGVIGTVVSRHRDVGRPTSLSFLGYLTDASDRRVNLKELRFRPSSRASHPLDVVVVVGTGMNTGKTTVTRKMLRALVSQGVPVAACKLTGTASPRDVREMRATGAVFATDFSDYGFPSTYGASIEELLQLFDGMVEACCRKKPRLVVMEIADGFLQREAGMLLASEHFRRRVRGVVLAGGCSGSALCAAESIQRAGLDLWAVSGLITNSPLFVQEFASRSVVPVVLSRGDDDWASFVMARLAEGTLEHQQEAAVRAD